MATGNERKYESDSDESPATQCWKACIDPLYREELLGKPCNKTCNQSTLAPDTCHEKSLPNDADTGTGSSDEYWTMTKCDEVKLTNVMLSDGEKECQRVERMIWDSGKISEEDVKYANEMLSEEEKECCKIQSLIYDLSKVDEGAIDQFLIQLKSKSLNLTQKSFQQMLTLLEIFLTNAPRFSQDRINSLINGN